MTRFRQLGLVVCMLFISTSSVSGVEEKKKEGDVDTVKLEQLMVLKEIKGASYDQSVKFEYRSSDDPARITKVVYEGPGAAESVSYTYDDSGNLTSAQKNNMPKRS